MRGILKAGKRESGHVLALALVLLGLGGVIIGPFLCYMEAGMRDSDSRQDKMLQFYALEAGLEDAINKAWMGDPDSDLPIDSGTQTNYTLSEDVNGNQVDVSIENVWALSGLEEAPGYGFEIPSGLTVVGYAQVGTGSAMYVVEFYYDQSVGDLPINKVAVWLPSGFEYMGSPNGITDQDPVENAFRGGTTLVWEFDPSVNFEDLPILAAGGGFQPGTEFPIKRVLTFEISPAENPRGALPWIRTDEPSLLLSWDSEYTIYKIGVTATDIINGGQAESTNEAYVARGRPYGHNVTQVQGDYRALGNSLMIDTPPSSSSGIRDTLLAESSATIEKRADYTDLTLPEDAEVEMAYLYWSAWWRNDAADTDVTFTFDDGTPEITNVTASRYIVADNVENPGSYSYSCFADVTELVSDIGDGGDGDIYTITLGGVDGLTNDSWSYAGWSLIIIYSSPSEKAHQLYLYDDFLYSGEYQEHMLSIEGFQAPDGEESTGRLTCFVGEGDERWTNDYIELNGVKLEDATNPRTNVWNGQSSGLGGGFIDGVDIDTFNVSDQINPGDTSATMKLGTANDSWNLVYTILSFRSDVTAESWEPYPMIIISY
ncbi:MAG: DUF3344 domain-containing protein [Chloroflexota bacterium]|nr:DUF3344 domain-containing protein [Chloroflexota bacterium]